MSSNIYFSHIVTVDAGSLFQYIQYGKMWNILQLGMICQATLLKLLFSAGVLSTLYQRMLNSQVDAANLVSQIHLQLVY